jgi:hypothetical protein
MTGRSIQVDRRRRDGDDFDAAGNVGTRLEAPQTDRDHIGVDGLVRVPGLGADPTPTFKAKGEHLHIGDDGDDIGRPARDQTVGDMLDSGHGFLVRDLGEPPKTNWRTTCEVCGDPLPPSAAGEWFCQFVEDKPASAMCNCNWCLHYQMWLRGEYKPNGGRPAKRCGTKECTKKAARERKRKSRARMSQKPPY